jgi:hypothetical protein
MIRNITMNHIDEYKVRSSAISPRSVMEVIFSSADSICRVKPEAAPITISCQLGKSVAYIPNAIAINPYEVHGEFTNGWHANGARSNIAAKGT